MTGRSSSERTSNGPLLSRTSTVYDAVGNVIQTTDAAGHVVYNSYDAAGNLTEVDDTVDGVARAVKHTYRIDGRLASTTDALGHTTQYTYDAVGNLAETTYADGSTTSATYDPTTGQQLTSTDQDSRVITYQYDAAGNLAFVILPAVLDPSTGQLSNPTTAYVYDKAGDLISETDPLGRTTTYGYDAWGHKVSENLPMGQTETWTYNGLGQLTSSTDFDGNVIKYFYDTLGRVYEKDEYAPGATTPATTVTYTYDNPDENDDGGHYDTVTVSGEGETTSYYDVHGRLVKIASPQGTIEYSYNPATGEETEVTTANTGIHYGYDELGRMTSVTVDALDGAGLSAPLVTTYIYNLNDQLAETDLPNGTVETRGYDDLHRLKSIVTTLGVSGPVLVGYTYQLDPDGNRLSVVEATGRTVHYEYDADGRLAEEAITNDPSAPDRTIDYTYDLASNRLIKSDTGAPAGQGTLYSEFDADGRLKEIANWPFDSATGEAPGASYVEMIRYDDDGNTLSCTTTIYDANGDMTLSETTTYGWDLEGRLVSAVTTQAGVVTQEASDGYDNMGARVWQTVDGQTTTYLNDANQAYDQVLEEYGEVGGNSVLAATYVRGLDLLFQDRTGTTLYYAVDGLDSTRALANPSGALTDTYTYDAYGDLIGQAGNNLSMNRYMFAAEPFDSAMQRYYLNARYYRTDTGGFDSRDSYEGNISKPITENHYLYGNADPINVIDPSGHDGDLISTTSASNIGGFLDSVEGEAGDNVLNYLKKKEVDTAEFNFKLLLAASPLLLAIGGGVMNLALNSGYGVANNIKGKLLERLMESRVANLGDSILTRVGEVRGGGFDLVTIERRTGGLPQIVLYETKAQRKVQFDDYTAITTNLIANVRDTISKIDADYTISAADKLVAKVALGDFLKGTVPSQGQRTLAY